MIPEFVGDFPFQGGSYALRASMSLGRIRQLSICPLVPGKAQPQVLHLSHPCAVRMVVQSQSRPLLLDSLKVATSS